MRKIWLAIVTLGFAMAAEPLAAASAGQEMRKFGLIGTWAQDCGRPPAGNNPYTIYVIPRSGPPTRTLQMKDRGLDGTWNVESARFVNNERLEISFTQRGTTFQIILQKSGGRYRSLQSIGSDGKTYIKDGRFSGGTTDVPWFSKCRGPAS